MLVLNLFNEQSRESFEPDFKSSLLRLLDRLCPSLHSSEVRYLCYSSGWTVHSSFQCRRHHHLSLLQRFWLYMLSRLIISIAPSLTHCLSSMPAHFGLSNKSR